MSDKRRELEAEIERVQGEIDNWEPDPDDYTEQYEDMLRETCGPVMIGSLEYDVAMVLKEVDPTAYRCGMNDWLDGELKEGTIEPDELKDELAELEDELADVEDEEEKDEEGAEA